ncbi:hypothetical protein SVIOM342S_09679 [Streptomyces violaceorubidus]
MGHPREPDPGRADHGAGRRAAGPGHRAGPDDLLAFFSALARLLGTAQGRALLRLSVERDDTLEDRRGPYWSERLGRAVVMVRRGVERGELAADTDPGLLIEAVSGPLFVRVLLSGAPLEDVLVRGLVDLALDGARPR